jgi:hypothetical protein
MHLPWWEDASCNPLRAEPPRLEVPVGNLVSYSVVKEPASLEDFGVSGLASAAPSSLVLFITVHAPSVKNFFHRPVVFFQASQFRQTAPFPRTIPVGARPHGTPLSTAPLHAACVRYLRSGRSYIQPPPTRHPVYDPPLWIGLPCTAPCIGQFPV